MKSKAPLALMEQLVMILVFALAAALCIQMFVISSTLSVGGKVRDDAATAVQNAAETLKLCGGDFEKMETLLGGEGTQDMWQIDMSSAEYSLFLLAQREKADLPFLGSARVFAQDENGRILFETTVCWQEENDG